MSGIVQTDKAPAPVGPYSQAIKQGNTLYLSGQIPLDPHTGDLVMDSFAAQCHQVLKNLSAVLEAGGSGLGNVLKVSIFLTDLSKFNEFNEIYAQYFSTVKPARSCVEASALPKGVDIEIEAVAWVDSPE